MKTIHIIFSFAVIFNAFTSESFPETITITIPKPRGRSDSPTLFNKQILTLALEKTKNEFGGYTIVETTLPMNTPRALLEAQKNTYPNLMLITSFQNQFLDNDLDYARFPVDLGITGYRIGFISQSARQKFKTVATLDDLKKFKIVQGAGWADVSILRASGLSVSEISSYESPFVMIAAGRADYFPRGINEIEGELKTRKRIPELDYDREIALEYNLPRFFISNKKNKAALDRITKGLLIAYKDGSFRKIWKNNYGQALNFANLRRRRIIHLKNPDTSRIDFNYRKYYIDPEKEK
jgi:hypothetical protein